MRIVDAAPRHQRGRVGARLLSTGKKMRRCTRRRLSTERDQRRRRTMKLLNSQSEGQSDLLFRFSLMRKRTKEVKRSPSLKLNLESALPRSREPP